MPVTLRCLRRPQVCQLAVADREKAPATQLQSPAPSAASTRIAHGRQRQFNAVDARENQDGDDGYDLLGTELPWISCPAECSCLSHSGVSGDTADKKVAKPIARTAMLPVDAMLNRIQP